MTKKIGNALNYLAALLSLVFGIIYLIKPTFMPYHSSALSLKWDELNQSTQYLILALMRDGSGGDLVLALVIFFLQYRFSREPVSWIPLLILLSGLILDATTAYATLVVRLNTPGHPPVILTVIALILLVAGYIMNRLTLKKTKNVRPGM